MADARECVCDSNVRAVRHNFTVSMHWRLRRARALHQRDLLSYISLSLSLSENDKSYEINLWMRTFLFSVRPFVPNV